MNRLHFAPLRKQDGNTEEIEARILDLRKRYNDVVEIFAFVEKKKLTIEAHIKTCEEKLREISNSVEQSEMFLDSNNF